MKISGVPLSPHQAQRLSFIPTNFPFEFSAEVGTSRISHARIDRSWCLLALLLTQTIPTQTSLNFICIYNYLYGYPRNNSDTFLGNAVHKVEKTYHLFLDYWRGGTKEKLQFFVLISAAWHAFCFQGNSKGLKIQDITNFYYPSPYCNLTLLHSELSAKERGDRR